MKWAKINLTAELFREIANDVVEEVVANADAHEIMTAREWQEKFESELCRVVRDRRADLALSGAEEN